MTSTKTPTGPGQLVRHVRTGALGITTGAPYKKSDHIPVMFVGASYATKENLEDVKVEGE